MTPTKEILVSKGTLIGTIVLMVLLWDTVLIYPFKIITVILHEGSHALMTLFTGGSVKELSLSPKQGGHVMSAGGSRFLILNAGYLGSLIFGLIIFLAGHHSKNDRQVVGVLSFIILSMLLLSPTLGAVIILLCVGGLLACVAFFANPFLNDLLLKVTGLTAAIYVPLDILYDTIFGSRFPSDARMLAEEYGGFTLMWGSVWLILSIALLLFMAKLFFRMPVAERGTDRPLS